MAYNCVSRDIRGPVKTYRLVGLVFKCSLHHGLQGYCPTCTAGSYATAVLSSINIPHSPPNKLSSAMLALRVKLRWCCFSMTGLSSKLATGLHKQDVTEPKLSLTSSPEPRGWGTRTGRRACACESFTVICLPVQNNQDGRCATVN